MQHLLGDRDISVLRKCIKWRHQANHNKILCITVPATERTLVDVRLWQTALSRSLDLMAPVQIA